MRPAFTVMLLLVLSTFTTSCGSGGGSNSGVGNTTSNTVPVANASPGKNAITGTLVTLNGSGSSDADGDALTYIWSFSSKPPSSVAILSSVIVSSPTFMADKDGTYVLNLVVNDGKVDSAASAVTIMAVTPVSGKIPDTNQTKSYTLTFGEDHDYTINPSAYIDNGDDTIIDGVTGLIWRKQTDKELIWSDALNYCNNLTLGGQTDWRLPSRTELITLLDYSRTDYQYPTIDTTYFPNANFSDALSAVYWSSTPNAANPSYAWALDFISGFFEDFFSTNKFNTFYVRCVRGPQSAPWSFTDNGNGTITDNVTHLIWQQDQSSLMTWEAALVTCETSTLAGNTDWRLPNFKELLSLVDDTRSDPSIDPNLFNSNGYFWSSTTSVTLYTNNVAARTVSFKYGDDGNKLKTELDLVRCVRGGQ